MNIQELTSLGDAPANNVASLGHAARNLEIDSRNVLAALENLRDKHDKQARIFQLENF